MESYEDKHWLNWRAKLSLLPVFQQHIQLDLAAIGWEMDWKLMRDVMLSQDYFEDIIEQRRNAYRANLEEHCLRYFDYVPPIILE